MNTVTIDYTVNDTKGWHICTADSIKDAIAVLEMGFPEGLIIFSAKMSLGGIPGTVCTGSVCTCDDCVSDRYESGTDEIREQVERMDVARSATANLFGDLGCALRTEL